MMLKQQYVFYLTIFVILTSCKSVAPLQPTEAYNQEINQFEKKSSTVNVPIHLSINSLQEKINTEIKGLLFSSRQASYGVQEMQIKVWKKGNIILEGKGSYMNYRVPIKIAVEINVLGVKQSFDFSVKLNFSNQLKVSTDWKVISQTSSNGFDWIDSPKINLAGFNFSLEHIIEDIVTDQLSDITKNIDREIENKFNLKEYAQQAWEMLSQPYLLSEKYSSWLRLYPISISMEPIHFSNSHIKTQIKCNLFTETVVGNKPPVKSYPLPYLQTEFKPKSEFAIYLYSIFDYEILTGIAKEALVGEVFTFKEGKYKIEVVDLYIYGQRDDLVIELALTGKLKGHIFLKAKPIIDNATNTLRMENIHYDIHTKNLLLKTADWMLHKKFTQQISEALILPLDHYIDQTQQQVNQTIDHYKINAHLSLKGESTKIKPEHIFIQKKGLVTMILVEGKVKLDVKL